MDKQNELSKSLSLMQSVGLALTMVIGSGLLIVPGIAYQKAGAYAIYAWVISSIIVIPILIVFSKLGSLYPSAGGIAGFMRNIFSKQSGIATELVILGTIPGGVGIAITGGKYFASIFNDNQYLQFCGTALLILIGGVVNLSGTKLSGKVQQILAFSIVFILLGTGIIALIYGNTSIGQGIGSIANISNAIPTVGLVFFTFVGWELMSFTSEEFKNPKRDFPLMIAISFIIVVILYLIVSISIQFLMAVNNPHLDSDPISELFSIVMGGFSGKFISVIGYIIICANFVSLIWAFSRLIFSSSKEGILPSFFSKVDTVTKTPKHAVILVLVIAIFSLMVTLFHANILNLSLLFELSGISFFFCYILCILGFIKISHKPQNKLFGILTLCLEVYIFVNFKYKILYPILIFLIGYIIGLRIKNKS